MPQDKVYLRFANKAAINTHLEAEGYPKIGFNAKTDNLAPDKQQTERPFPIEEGIADGVYWMVVDEAYKPRRNATVRTKAAATTDGVFVELVEVPLERT